MLEITFVKKKLKDGSWCAKCNDVSLRLEKDGLSQIVNQIVVADVNAPESEGIQLAQQHNVDRAPFFIVTNTITNAIDVFDVYFKFKRFVERSEQVAA